jgi:ATP-dependent DNA ligase
MPGQADGYRLIVRRDGAAVCLFTRRGYYWAVRYPATASAAAWPLEGIRQNGFPVDPNQAARHEATSRRKI